MIFINPQWQGSGLTDELRKGADTIAAFLQTEYVTVPLSNEELTTVNDIKCYYPILAQTTSFRKIISDYNPERISTIGGDCGIEIIPISYLNKLYNNDLCILWIDAHADLNTPASSPSKTFHGMPLRTLLNEGDERIKSMLFSFINPRQICFAGLRDLDAPEKEFIDTNNISSLSTCNQSAIENAIRGKGYSKLYIHLDLDVLDQKEFKHTLFPSSNGFQVSEVVELLKTLKKNFHVVGMCITESTAGTPDELKPIVEILEQVKC